VFFSCCLHRSFPDTCFLPLIFSAASLNSNQLSHRSSYFTIVSGFFCPSVCTIINVATFEAIRGGSVRDGLHSFPNTGTFLLLFIGHNGFICVGAFLDRNHLSLLQQKGINSPGPSHLFVASMLCKYQGTFVFCLLLHHARHPCSPLLVGPSAPQREHRPKWWKVDDGLALFLLWFSIVKSVVYSLFALHLDHTNEWNSQIQNYDDPLFDVVCSFEPMRKWFISMLIMLHIIQNGVEDDTCLVVA